MTTTHSLFVFPATGQQVRTVMKGDAPWFVGADACRCLGMDVSKGVYRHIGGLRDDEKTHEQIVGMRGGAATLISESGLYKLIMRSDKPQARQFQDWVTRDVLPAIRKDGVYVRGEELLKRQNPVSRRSSALVMSSR